MHVPWPGSFLLPVFHVKMSGQVFVVSGQLLFSPKQIWIWPRGSALRHGMEYLNNRSFRHTFSSPSQELIFIHNILCCVLIMKRLGQDWFYFKPFFTWLRNYYQAPDHKPESPCTVGGRIYLHAGLYTLSLCSDNVIGLCLYCLYVMEWTFPGSWCRLVTVSKVFFRSR